MSVQVLKCLSRERKDVVAKAMQHFGRTYLVDVLQRISSISIHDVDQLMPRIWKEKFAQDPLTSDLLRE